MVLGFELIPCAAQVLPSGGLPPTADRTGMIQSYPFLISPGDVLSIQVFDTPQLSENIRVDENGYVALPLGGLVKVSGLTPKDAAAAIEQQLITGQVMLQPYVSVAVTQYAVQGVTVGGEVNRPGIYSLYGPHSLYDVLSSAGGPTVNEGSDIRIGHQGDPAHPLVVDVHSANYSEIQRTTMVMPGDTVIVSKADLIYVVGDVGRPGSLPIQYGVPLSILNVIGLAQGLNRTAASKHASIIRQHGSTVETIPVDLDAVMHSKAPNSMLMASDILVVPRSGAKVFMEYALPSFTSSVTGAVASALVIR